MGKSQKISHPRRGEIYLVRFDPTEGAEIRKTRPALIIQNDIGNRYSQVTIVAPITSQDDAGRVYPTRVPIPAGEGGLAFDSAVVLNQIRTIDKARLGRRLGRVTARTLNAVNQAIAISLGLVEM